jgi:hypothetical protein
MQLYEGFVRPHSRAFASRKYECGDGIDGTSMNFQLSSCKYLRARNLRLACQLIARK